jgi:hypothetical protein
MSYSKSIAIVLTAFVCATAIAADAGAQSRGRTSSGHATVGTAAPRAVSPRVVTPGVGFRAPLRSSYYPYYYGYRPGLTIGFGLGYPYYYGAYGYGYPYYGAYGSPYYSAYGYNGYGYGADGYYPGAYPAPVAPGYAVRSGYAGAAYGGVRIQGAPRQAEVFVDGYYAGIVDDYDGTFQRLDLQAGPHAIEVRTPGRPLTYDVNVTPGQTLTIHANVR